MNSDENVDRKMRRSSVALEDFEEFEEHANRGKQYSRSRLKARRQSRFSSWNDESPESDRWLMDYHDDGDDSAGVAYNDSIFAPLRRRRRPNRASRGDNAVTRVPNNRSGKVHQMPCFGTRSERDIILPKKTFFFQERHGKLDIRSIAKIDINKVIEETDVNTLQKHLENLIFSDVTLLDVEHYSDEYFLKIFQISQLTLEYLLNVQESLIEHCETLENQCAEIKTECESLETKSSSQDEEIAQLQREIRQKQKTISTYELLLLQPPKAMDASANEDVSCPSCPLGFPSFKLMQAHHFQEHMTTDPYPTEKLNVSQTKIVECNDPFVYDITVINSTGGLITLKKREESTMDALLIDVQWQYNTPLEPHTRLELVYHGKNLRDEIATCKCLAQVFPKENITLYAAHVENEDASELRKSNKDEDCSQVNEKLMSIAKKQEEMDKHREMYETSMASIQCLIQETKQLQQALVMEVTNQKSETTSLKADQESLSKTLDSRLVDLQDRIIHEVSRTAKETAHCIREAERKECVDHPVPLDMSNAQSILDDNELEKAGIERNKALAQIEEERKSFLQVLEEERKKYQEEWVQWREKEKVLEANLNERRTENVVQTTTKTLIDLMYEQAEKYGTDHGLDLIEIEHDDENEIRKKNQRKEQEEREREEQVRAMELQKRKDEERDRVAKEKEKEKAAMMMKVEQEISKEMVDECVNGALFEVGSELLNCERERRRKQAADEKEDDDAYEEEKRNQVIKEEELERHHVAAKKLQAVVVGHQTRRKLQDEDHWDFVIDPHDGLHEGVRVSVTRGMTVIDIKRIISTEFEMDINQVLLYDASTGQELHSSDNVFDRRRGIEVEFITPPEMDAMELPDHLQSALDIKAIVKQHTEYVERGKHGRALGSSVKENSTTPNLDNITAHIDEQKLAKIVKLQAICRGFLGRLKAEVKKVDNLIESRIDERLYREIKYTIGDDEEVEISRESTKMARREYLQAFYTHDETAVHAKMEDVRELVKTQLEKKMQSTTSKTRAKASISGAGSAGAALHSLSQNDFNQRMKDLFASRKGLDAVVQKRVSKLLQNVDEIASVVASTQIPSEKKPESGEKLDHNADSDEEIFSEEGNSSDEKEKDPMGDLGSKDEVLAVPTEKEDEDVKRVDKDKSRDEVDSLKEMSDSDEEETANREKSVVQSVHDEVLQVEDESDSGLSDYETAAKAPLTAKKSVVESTVESFDLEGKSSEEVTSTKIEVAQVEKKAMRRKSSSRRSLDSIGDVSDDDSEYIFSDTTVEELNLDDSGEELANAYEKSAGVHSDVHRGSKS